MLHGADTTAVVRWPDDRLATTDDDRLANADWEIGVQLWQDPEWGDSWQSQPWPMQRRIMKQYLRVNAAFYAEQQPHIAALYTGGACLFLAGSNPSDNITGTALTWIVLNTKTGDTAVIRLPRPGLRVRDVTAHHIYATHRDTDGVWFIERYPLRGIDWDGH